MTVSRIRSWYTSMARPASVTRVRARCADQQRRDRVDLARARARRRGSRAASAAAGRRPRPRRAAGAPAAAAGSSAARSTDSSVSIGARRCRSSEPARSARGGDVHDVREAHQLADEERTAAGFPHDRIRAPRFRLGRRAAGWPDRAPPSRSARAPRSRGMSCPGSAAGRPEGSSIRSASLVPASSLRYERDEQQRRRVRRPQQIDQERGAVGVAPVQVVDEQHDRPAAAPGARTARGTRRTRGAAAPASRRSRHCDRG